jgi:hypothetical protein
MPHCASSTPKSRPADQSVRCVTGTLMPLAVRDRLPMRAAARRALYRVCGAPTMDHMTTGPRGRRSRGDPFDILANAILLQ